MRNSFEEKWDKYMSTAAFALGLVAFIASLLRLPSIEVDYLSIIVTALSILTTVLLVYNAVQYFEVRQMKEDMKKEADRALHEALLSQSAMSIYLFSAQKGYTQHSIYFMIKTIVQSIVSASKLGDFNTTGEMADILMSIYKKKKEEEEEEEKKTLTAKRSAVLTPTQAKDIQSLLLETEYPKNVKNFFEIMNLIGDLSRDDQ